ncbi:hypothetical protein FEM48_Zijuj01G0123000 [Ziziphus jujuba var. spinosa]|uniref:WRKY domain-containing protein n=1 Tax=Ziziphus jujuba var. spinosa TaxID=714518 RepID=A0A978W180_ZIZJJ|nr:hypothetical protein FEM48_Zijuj01G0123000 [Ziziphus jujuba var. spinosa]
MDKGWGLTLNSDCIGFFLNKPPPSAAAASAVKLDHNKRNHPFAAASRMFSGAEFPVKLGRTDIDHTSSDDNNNNRLVVDEVDFFSDKNRPAATAADDDGSKTIGFVSVKKENSHGDVAARPGLDVNTGLHLLTANTGSDQSTVDDGISSDVEDKRAKNIELAQLQGELQHMNAENQKLKDMLTQVTNNYSALQMHLVSIMQHQQINHQKNQELDDQTVEGKSDDKKNHHHEIGGGGGAIVPRQFLDLRPSSATAETDDQVSNSSSEDRTRSATPQNVEVASKDYVGKSEIAPFDQENSTFRDGKRLGREESPESETQGWVPNKVPKLNNGGSKPIDQQQSSSEATMRKARVSVRARSEAPMITDGCQWRKYGQKMAKGNPCPRAYYRCTMAVGCPVRKQVQRCADDRTILITTYEGNHNHPLPPAALAMANTTAAAASMLLTGSTSSADGLMNPNLLARAILPCSSNMATISASAPFPTVTLDLTNNSPNPLQFQRPPQPQFQIPFAAAGQVPQNFASSSTSSLPQVFGQALYNQSKFSGLQLSQEMGSSQLGQQAAQMLQTQPASFADTVSAATAAITADPNFTAALAAAISSIISGGHPNNNNNNTNTSSNSNITTSNNNNNSKIGSFTGN